MHTRDSVVLGRVAGLHGVRGWLKVYSHTDPRDGIVGYSPWRLVLGDKRQDAAVEDSRLQAGKLMVKLAGIDDRDAAAGWVGASIDVERSRLPSTAPDEFYWADLVGLTVETIDGQSLGRVERLFETGANDVLVVAGERERLIPWLPGEVVESVNLDAGILRVRWDPEF